MKQLLPEQVNLATITRKMLQTSAIKLNVATVGALAKFVVEMGFEGTYLEEVAEHHSQHINPTELSVSHDLRGHRFPDRGQAHPGQAGAGLRSFHSREGGG